MTAPFDILVQELQPSVDIFQFLQYLQYQTHPDFLQMKETLQQQDISIQDYSHYLEQRYPVQENFDSTLSTKTPFQDPSTCSDQPEIRFIEKIGIRLLREHALKLDEVNEVLRELPANQQTAKNILQSLFRKKKISSKDFLFLNQGQWDTASENDLKYTMVEQNGRLALILSSNKPLQFGHYQILQELGRGGMGIVYKAYHLHLQQIVALKVILAGTGASEKSVQRFQREIQAMAKLNHPGIVQILDSGKENQQYYFAMEFVSGISLKSYSASLREKIILFKKILEGLASAHQQNIIHRDLKLDNILVTSEGNPKILDFGLAKDLSWTREDQQLTQTGTILGSGHYMSPEQAAGKISELSPRSDVYAVGICLYRLLTKHFPFEAPTFPQLLSKIIHEDLPLPSFFEKNLHPDLEAILLKSLEKDPQKRYSDALEFSKDLERFLEGTPVEARSLTFRERTIQWIKRNKIFITGTMLTISSLLLFLGIFYQVRVHEQNRIFDFHYQDAIQSLSRSEIARQQKDFLFFSQYHLQALNALNRASTLKPGVMALEELRQKTGYELFILAYEKKSFQMAEFVLYLITSMGPLELSLKELWQEELEREKQKAKKKDLQRFDFWVNHLRTMDWNLSSTREQATDALYEISKMSEPEITEALIRLLKESHPYFFNATPSKNDPHYLFYIWVIQVIRRQENATLVPYLIEGFTLFQPHLEKLVSSRNPTQIHYLVALFQALGDLPAEDFLLLLEEFRWAFEDKANFSFRTRRAYLKLLEKKSSETPSLETEEEYRYQGVQKLEKKDYSGAIQDLTKAIQINPLTAENYNLRGLTRYEQGDYSDAIRDFSMALELWPDYVDALNNRGLAKEEQQDYVGSLEDFNKVILLNPQDSACYTNRGNIHLAQGDLAKAISDFTSAIRYDPANFKAYSNRGIIRNMQEKYSEALADFNAVLKLDPEYSDAYNNRGNTKQALQDWAGALEDYNRAIHFNPQNFKIYLNRGMLKATKGDLEGALIDYEEGIRLAPSQNEAYSLRAEVYCALEDLDKALQDFNRAIEISSEDPRNFFNRGLLYQELKDFPKALEDFNHYIKTEPKQPLAYVYRGEVKKALKDLKGALDDFNVAIELEPESTRPFLARGLLYYSKKAWKRALADFSQILKLDSDDTEAYFHRGKTKYQLHDFSDALLDFDQAIQREPKYTQAYYERGLTQHAQSKLEEARKDFTIFLKRSKKSTSRKVLRQRKNVFKLLPELKTKH